MVKAHSRSNWTRSNAVAPTPNTQIHNGSAYTCSGEMGKGIPEHGAKMPKFSGYISTRLRSVFETDVYQLMTTTNFEHVARIRLLIFEYEKPISILAPLS